MDIRAVLSTHHNNLILQFSLSYFRLSLEYNILYLKLWKVWTQESFQKVEFDRPGEHRPDDQTQPFDILYLVEIFFYFYIFIL